MWIWGGRRRDLRMRGRVFMGEGGSKDLGLIEGFWVIARRSGHYGRSMKQHSILRLLVIFYLEIFPIPLHRIQS